MAILKPSPSSPSRFSAGTRTSSKLQLGGGRAADPHLVLEARHGEAGRLGLDDEGAHPLAAARVRIGQREDGQQVGDAAMGDEALGAVQDVVSRRRDGRASGCWPRRCRRQPRSGRRRSATPRRPAAGSIGPSARPMPAMHDRQRAELLDDGDQAGGGVGTRDLLRHDRLADACPARCRRSAPRSRCPSRSCLASSSFRSQGNSALASISAARGAIRSIGQLAHHGAQLVVLGGRQIGHGTPSFQAGVHRIANRPPEFRRR